MAKPKTYKKDEFGTVFTSIDAHRDDVLMPDGKLAMNYSRAWVPASANIVVEIKVDGKKETLFTGDIPADEGKWVLAEVRIITRGDVAPESVPTDPDLEV